MDLAEAFARHFPIASEYYALELVPATVYEHGGGAWGGIQEMQSHLVATLRLIVWEELDGARSIRDIKEQELVVVFKTNIGDVRVPAYFEGSAAALRYLFERLDELRGESRRIATAMPHELFFPDLLELRRPQTADEFTDALLSSKKRLGRLLP